MARVCFFLITNNRFSVMSLNDWRNTGKLFNISKKYTCSCVCQLLGDLWRRRASTRDLPVTPMLVLHWQEVCTFRVRSDNGGKKTPYPYQVTSVSCCSRSYAKIQISWRICIYMLYILQGKTISVYFARRGCWYKCNLLCKLTPVNIQTVSLDSFILKFLY